VDKAPPAAPASYEVISSDSAVREPAAERDIFADLARRAAERSAEFVRARRLAAERPAADVHMPAASMPEFAGREESRRDTATSPRPSSAKRTNGSVSLIGHNSNGVDVDADANFAGSRPSSFAELAAHAASVHAAFVAEKRKRLTAFTIPSQTGAADKSNSNDPASDKRNKHKEA
jgi:hypothetical protein